MAPEISRDYEAVGGTIAKLAELLALFVFGVLVPLDDLAALDAGAWAVVLVAVFLARPVAFTPVLAGTSLDRYERAAISWFGPRGFATVVFGLLVVARGAPHSGEIFHVIALAVSLSIIVHSSTDVIVARHFASAEANAGRQIER